MCMQGTQLQAQLFLQQAVLTGAWAGLMLAVCQWQRYGTRPVQRWVQQQEQATTATYQLTRSNHSSRSNSTTDRHRRGCTLALATR